jgi:hypothetical protein
VELEPTLLILLDSLSELVSFDAGGIFIANPARAPCAPRRPWVPLDLHRATRRE